MESITEGLSKSLPWDMLTESWGGKQFQLLADSFEEQFINVTESPWRCGQGPECCGPPSEILMPWVRGGGWRICISNSFQDAAAPAFGESLLWKAMSAFSVVWNACCFSVGTSILGKPGLYLFLIRNSPFHPFGQCQLLKEPNCP